MSKDLVTSDLTVITGCGPSSNTCECRCPDSCGHQWDGPEESFDEGLGWSVTCSKCGMSAVSHDMWVGP